MYVVCKTLTVVLMNDRKDGKAVKSTHRDPMHWRFTIWNHPETERVRGVKMLEIEQEKSKREATAAATEEKKKSKALYESGFRSDPPDATSPLRAAYNYSEEVKDLQCTYCKGFFVTWVALDIKKTSQEKTWKTLPCVENMPNISSCTLKTCQALLTDERVKRKPFILAAKEKAAAQAKV